jgi:hypothetical protein
MGLSGDPEVGLRACSDGELLYYFTIGLLLANCLLAHRQSHALIRTDQVFVNSL